MVRRRDQTTERITWTTVSAPVEID
jgi:hypothetical protein